MLKRLLNAVIRFIFRSLNINFAKELSSLKAAILNKHTLAFLLFQLMTIY